MIQPAQSEIHPRAECQQEMQATCNSHFIPKRAMQNQTSMKLLLAHDAEGFVLAFCKG